MSIRPIPWLALILIFLQAAPIKAEEDANKIETPPPSSTISCILKNKNDPSISIGAIFILDDSQATSQFSGKSSLNLTKISKNIYKKEALFGTITLDIEDMTLAGTGVNSAIYAKCKSLQ